MQKRIVSGIKPSGDLHLGNYLGAIQQWLDLQHGHETFLFIADLHAITVPQAPDELRAKTLEIAKIYLAAGLDPKRVTMFVQSHVPEHAELGWILGTLARIGDLEKMTQFKDKTKEGSETAGVGLFTYPVLMAGDIALYDADLVPVGDDQLQHLELTRTLVRRFNKRFGETLKVPEPMIQSAGARIMGLDNPEKKMSKSAASEYNYIALSDEPGKAKKKIMKAVTDSGSEVVYTQGKPALRNLIHIFALLSGQKSEDIAGRYAGKGYADFKKDLADVVGDFLSDFQSRLAAISDDEAIQILRMGAARAGELAAAKMKTVREKVGFLQ